MGCLICATPHKTTHKAYEGDCKHENTYGCYGFRSSIGVMGIGGYDVCEDCEASTFDPDWERSTDEEKEWYNASPFKDGAWVTTTYHKHEKPL